MNHITSVVAHVGDNLHVESDVHDTSDPAVKVFVLRISNTVSIQTSDPVVAAQYFAGIAASAQALADTARGALPADLAVA